jgi:hypothetical protein
MRRWSAAMAACMIMAGSAAPARAAGANTSQIIAQATTSAEAGGPGAGVALGALIDALRASGDPDDQRRLIDTIGTLGDASGNSPASVKAYLRTNAPAALLDVARSHADWVVRGEALLCLRTIDAPDDALRQAIAIAEADTSPQQGFMHSRAVILRGWLDSRAGHQTAGVAAPADAGAERQALAVLRSRNIGVSYDSLTTALQTADVAVVAALLDAGVQVGPANAARAYAAVTSGLAVVCQKTPVPNDKIGQALTLLIDHGLPIGYADEMGNTMLLSAAQYCPAPVVAWVLALGATVDPVNRQQFTPLKMALVTGKWDVAKLLVDHGAHLTTADVARLFIEPPRDPDVRDLIARATR